MTIRHVTAALAAVGLVTAMAAPASAAAPAHEGPGKGIRSVTAITKVYTFGQKVAAVAIEYPDEVNPRTLDRNTFTVSDSIYNFRFSPLEDLQKRADRTVTRLYTNDRPAIDPHGRSGGGRFVVVELDPEDPGGNTVIRSKCSGFLCSEKINPALPTEVIQNEDIHARRHGRVLAPGGPTRYPLTRKPINLLADEFHYRTFDFNGTAVPYAFHLPARYNPRRAYPLVVVLPGWGSGFDLENEGVQVAVDITVTAWLQPRWTGSREDVIVLSPQTQRIGVEAESAALMALLDSFMVRHRIDQDRVYVSTFSWGSMLAYDTMSKRPDLFDAALINAGFRINPDQAARAATVRIPFWITHGTSDPVLPVVFGRDTTRILREAYVAAGVDPAEAEDLIRFTEYPDEAYSLPDYHAVVGPTYEDGSALRWLLDQ
jgi:predicted peptidase